MAKAPAKKCESCGRNIPKARVAALPDTIYCVECTDTEQQDTPRLDIISDAYSSENCTDILQGDD
jgi:RNA polymerase-binding transcription factor DksA